MDFELIALLSRAADHTGVALEAMRDRGWDENCPVLLSMLTTLALIKEVSDGGLTSPQREALAARLDEEFRLIHDKLGDIKPPLPWLITCVRPADGGEPFAMRGRGIFWADSAAEAVNQMVDQINDDPDLNWIGYTADSFRADQVDPETYELIEPEPAMSAAE